MEGLENVKLNFSDNGLLAMNISLAIIMFAVALGMNFEDFKELKRHPRSVLSGLVSQWLLLPLLTLFLVMILKPHPLLGMGMFLVAVCPGGNVSNFYSLMGGGNVALSVVLTAFSSVFAALLTPYGYAFWIMLSPYSSNLGDFSLSLIDIALTLGLILVVPLLLGWLLKTRKPLIAAKLSKPMRFIGIGILALFIGMAVWNNRAAFEDHLSKVFYLVLIHNLSALTIAWIWARLSGNAFRESVTITIETGIQNSGLALVIIFSFFNGNGGMGLIAAWWGVWHLISGFVLAYVFQTISSRRLRAEQLINRSGS